MADPVQAARVAFNAMREGLVARGLLDHEFRLTAAGDAHVDEIIATRKAEIARRSCSLPARQAA